MEAKQNYGPAVFQEAQEHPTAILADVHGNVPSWISGTFFRVGPGKYQWGNSSYNHWFEGEALLFRFHVTNGRIEFSSKFLQSAAYLESMKKNAITRSDFATNSIPDPCQNIFQRFMSYFFTPIKARDNCHDNIVRVKNGIYATGDLVELWEIDQNTLDCRSCIDVAKVLPGRRSWTAHPHFESNGDYYNCSAAYDKKVYEFVRIPAITNKGKAPLDGIEVVASVPFGQKPSYFHSFGLTEHFFIFIEGSLFIDNYFQSQHWNELTLRILDRTHRDLMVFNPKTKSRLQLVERKTGQAVVIYEVEPFFTFHQVNAYETEDEVVFDLAVYPDDSVIDKLYLSELWSGKTEDAFPAELRRYRLPLKGVHTMKPLSMPLQKYPSGLDHDLIHPSYEMPKINYEYYNGKRYCYTYGVGNSSIRRGLTTLIKINVDTKETWEWQEANCYPSEPVFIPAPDAEKEDDGVIMSAVLGVFQEKSFLLILDGETMNEIARAYVPAKLIPLFHGDYFAT